MRKILAAATFLTIITTPALAQTYDPDMGTGNVAPFVFGPAGESAYAQAPANPALRRTRSRHLRSLADSYNESPYAQEGRINREFYGSSSAPGVSVDKDETRYR